MCDGHRGRLGRPGQKALRARQPTPERAVYAGVVRAAVVSMLVLVCGATSSSCTAEAGTTETLGCEAASSSCLSVPPTTDAQDLCTITSESSSTPLRVSLVGKGSCDRGFEATVEMYNTTGSKCGSDILASVQPGNHPMWFASTSGEGGATGRWEVRPEGTEGVGLMAYPPGRKTWPIEVPHLDPGSYTFSVPGVTCGKEQQVFESTFRIDIVV